MAYTDKQLRNGATGDSATQDTARPSVDLTATISGLQSQAEAAGNDRWNEGRGLIESPAGAGGGREVGAGGSMWEWDAGLAINEMSGEA